MTLKPSDALARSEELLIEDGWTQNVAQNHRGERCLIGALARSSGWSFGIDGNVHFDSNLYKMCQIYTAKALGMTSGQIADMASQAIVHWNDVNGRTLEEVLELLHSAQLLAKEEGR